MDLQSNYRIFFFFCGSSVTIVVVEGGCLWVGFEFCGVACLGEGYTG